MGAGTGTIWAACPECGARIEFECDYAEWSAPWQEAEVRALGSLAGDSADCAECGVTVHVEAERPRLVVKEPEWQNCPYCGHWPRLSDVAMEGFSIVCDGCRARGPARKTAREAVRAWNEMRRGGE